MIGLKLHQHITCDIKVIMSQRRRKNACRIDENIDYSRMDKD
jgi:hypothetical protein